MTKPKNSEATWEFVHRMDTLALEKLTAEVVRLTEALKDEKAVSDYRADEITRLKAEVERLTAEKDQAECDYDNCQKRLVRIDDCRCDLFMENKKLKAEVERLRKAGDAMAADLLCSDFPLDVCIELRKEWNAAKEGKPSV